MPKPFAVADVTLVRTDGDGELVPHQSVRVDENGLIEQIGPKDEVRVPAGWYVADGRGRFLVPGLINAHVHLFSDGKPLPSILTSEAAESVTSTVLHSPIGRKIALGRARKNLTTLLHSGVTTVRSLGDVKFEVVQAASEIEAGRLKGPRTFASGPIMAATGGHGVPLIAQSADVPWQHRRNVRKNLRAGVTAIKIAATGGVTDARALGEAGRPQLTEEEMAAICEEAHVAGLVVAAHAQSTEGVLRALRSGVDTIEHGAPMNAEIIDLFGQNPKSLHGWSAMIPTLNAALPMVKLDRDLTGVSKISQKNCELVLEGMLQGTQDAIKNGVAIGVGTDSAMPLVTQYNTWRELDYLCRYTGISKARALHCATAVNASILGIGDRTGSIEVGKVADLVLLERNPLEDFRAFVNPLAVSAGGRVSIRPQVERFEQIEQLLDTL